MSYILKPVRITQCILSKRDMRLSKGKDSKEALGESH